MVAFAGGSSGDGRRDAVVAAAGDLRAALGKEIGEWRVACETEGEWAFCVILALDGSVHIPEYGSIKLIWVGPKFANLPACSNYGAQLVYQNRHALTYS
jgi:hypothetical protein